MIIHINPTLQSYLVPEKKMIIFLKHAGATPANIDMNIYGPCQTATKPTPRAHWRALTLTRPRRENLIRP